MMQPETHVFNGVVYYLFDWTQTEDEANRELDSLRSIGYKAEKTPAREGFQIWTNPRHWPGKRDRENE